MIDQDKLKKHALEKFAGDQASADEFIEGFNKEAASLQSILNTVVGPGTTQSKRDPETLGHTINKGIGKAMGEGLGGLAVGLGATSIGTLYNSVRGMALHSKFLQALERAYQGNRILKESPKEKVLQYAETIFKFAPNVATDSNLLSSILANAIHGDGIDPMTIKTLTELEGRYADNTTFNPKSYT
jgi:hypothetical protein